MTQTTFNACLVLLFLLLDVALLLGLDFFIHFYRPVKELSRAASILSSTKLGVVLGPCEPLGVMSKRLLYDLLSAATRDKPLSALSRYHSFTLGRAMVILQANNTAIRRTVREIKLYAFFVAVLALVGVLFRTKELPVISISAIFHDIGDHPFHVMDALAVAAIVFLGIRLFVELSRLAELLDSA